MKSKIKFWIRIVLLFSMVFIIAMMNSETLFYKTLNTWRKYVTPYYMAYEDNPLLQDKFMPIESKNEVDVEMQNIEINKEKK